ncbi:MAG: DUF262 domain-containing HNH endonuclease family protein [Candidatus Cloacimonetes bacterium]|nr:DUF262 domain-containing HNH endonuclease family protein [Candidatus Cloacimonadota bacterium]
MEARQINLLSFISGEDKRLIIPVFQRNYDWKLKHCEKLLNDIINLIDNPIRKSHFIGSIVYISNSEVDMVDLREYVIIDGQQRITTIILLLKAIYDIIEETNISDLSSLKNKIYEYYLINKFQKEQNKLRLKPMKEDDIAFQQLMNKLNDEINNDSNIIKNYSYLKSELMKSNYNLKQIFDATQKLMIVYISLKRGEDDPQLIFESINSTGVSLTQADLIRNFILMDKEPEEQERLFEKFWYPIENNLTNDNISNFVRDFLTMKNKRIPKKSDVYFEFKDFVISSKINSEQILRELKYYSNLYSQILFNKTENNDINILLRKLNRLKITVSYPFLLIIFRKYDEKIITLEEITTSLRIINSYVFRRLICELPSNALNKIFTTLNDDVEKLNSDGNSFSDKLANILLIKRYSSAFPTNQEFKISFIGKNVYSFKHRNYLLEELENFDNKEKVNINNLTIEHIMPQKLSNQWKAKLGAKYDYIHEIYLHKIGNLTLSAYNGNMSNKPFKQKKEILKTSRLQLNQSIMKYEEWSDKEIIDRSEKLAEKAILNWEFPDLKIEDKRHQIIDQQEYFTFDDEISVTGLQPYSFEILGDKFSVSSWREFFTKIVASLYSLDSNKIKHLINDEDFHGKYYKIITQNQAECRKAHQIIKNELYVEINLSANSILNYTKLICEKIGLENSDIKFWLK